MDRDTAFHGAKVAYFCADQILVYRRDDVPEIPFPNMLDLPGGGRENIESGAECVARETEEEFGIVIDPEELTLVQQYENWRGEGRPALFYVGKLTHRQIAQIKFGDEGQNWEMMAVSEFLTHEDGVPHLQSRLKEYLDRRS